MKAYFVSDLHGHEDKYKKLFDLILDDTPDCVFIGGDVLPVYYKVPPQEFLDSFLLPQLKRVKKNLQNRSPAFYLITGNDDPAFALPAFQTLHDEGLIYFANNRKFSNGSIEIFGYPCVPPTPFLLKDFEKYDISRYVPHRSVSPEEGIRTVDVPINKIKWSTIKFELNELTYGFEAFDNCIMLFHAPPFDTCLDKIIGKNIEGNDEVISVGSIAIRKFIEAKQPMVTLHGHIHESESISGSWKDKIGKTICCSASYDGTELAVVAFTSENPLAASRFII